MNTKFTIVETDVAIKSARVAQGAQATSPIVAVSNRAGTADLP